MQITETYSHLNGLEFLLVHRPKLWGEIKHGIASIGANSCLTKVSQGKRTLDDPIFSATSVNAAFKQSLNELGWSENRINYWVTRNENLIRKTLAMNADEQKQEILDAGELPISSYNQTDFVKERVAVEVQFGKYAFVAYDLFVKHLAFYVRDEIDVGIEILPMKTLQAQMSSGVAYYEGEFYNVIRNGRGVPSVPLVLIGIDV